MIANASLAASALELNVGNDAARTVVSTVDLLAGARTWSKEVAVDEMVGAAVRGGCEVYAVMDVCVVWLDLAMWVGKSFCVNLSWFALIWSASYWLMQLSSACVVDCSVYRFLGYCWADAFLSMYHSHGLSAIAHLFPDLMP